MSHSIAWISIQGKRRGLEGEGHLFRVREVPLDLGRRKVVKGVGGPRWSVSFHRVQVGVIRVTLRDLEVYPLSVLNVLQ